jgi:hypothetical protein
MAKRMALASVQNLYLISVATLLLLLPAQVKAAAKCTLSQAASYVNADNTLLMTYRPQSSSQFAESKPHRIA